MLEGDPPVPVRYSFCQVPDGEQIELLQAAGSVLAEEGEEPFLEQRQ